MLVGLVVSGVYAAGLLRGRTDAHHRLGFTIPFGFASVAAIAQPFVGHVLGLQIGGIQRAKLAAFELAMTTEPAPAPERLGGVLIDGDVRWALPIPWIGSFIARGTFSARCNLDIRNQAGCRSTSPTCRSSDGGDRHAARAGGRRVLAGLKRGHDLANRWFLRFCVSASPLAILALELGWVATQVGPSRGRVAVLRTTDAASGQRIVVGTACDHLPRHDRQGRSWFCGRWRRGALEEDLPARTVRPS
jgi:cytochrome d ubiquinol oxidase subunit I